MRTLLKLVLLLALCAGAVGAWLYRDHQQVLNRPLNLGSESLRYTVSPGQNLRQVAEDLAARDVLRRPLYLVLRARWEGKASKIKAGEYDIPSGTTPMEMLDLFISGKVVQYSLTVVEGWTFVQMMHAVRRHERLVHTLEGLDAAAIMARIGQPEAHPEGRFFPDTYRFPRGTSDLDFLKRAHRTMEQRLEREWAERADGLPYKSPYEALIMASIIEKETAVPSERTRIAGVFVRRLEKRMRLQTDPTVIYGLGENYDGNIRRVDLKRDTPYNTYTRRGLPPTPIAMPGGASIHAALNPKREDYLYFVAKGDGSHHFSPTYKEHQRAVVRYQLRRKKN